MDMPQDTRAVLGGPMGKPTTNEEPSWDGEGCIPWLPIYLFQYLRPELILFPGPTWEKAFASLPGGNLLHSKVVFGFHSKDLLLTNFKAGIYGKPRLTRENASRKGVNRVLGSRSQGACRAAWV